MNPLMKPRGMAEAQWAAQSMAFALVVSFLGGLPASIWLVKNPGWFTDIVTAQQGVSGLSEAQIASMTPYFEASIPMMFTFSILVTAAVYAVLAWVQWRQMTRWIPIVWLALAAYGGMMMIVRRATGVADLIQIGPGWMYGLSLACSIAATIIAVASLRGATMLYRLRREP
ncbi:hypothetical protein [Brevundimonas sp.]|uniref:hypothetical protein n=1 Tax=Brevundimonas sp. TaxID=1871086 RepID=UPI003D11124D